jgi:hypothetical protein
MLESPEVEALLLASFNVFFSLIRFKGAESTLRWNLLVTIMQSRYFRSEVPVLQVLSLVLEGCLAAIRFSY